nr:leucine-rich repeat receptor-like serine/threonine/tyrosine-protein kinase sobir1 [Quercus suber]
MGKIRHRNLVPLLAHVSHGDCHYLVYEFMKNGSLQDVLDEASNGTKEFDWLARYKIALGVTIGLEQMHFLHNPCIIYRDLKPANLLLNDDMEVRISDFGIAKVMPDANIYIIDSNVGRLPDKSEWKDLISQEEEHRLEHISMITDLRYCGMTEEILQRLVTVEIGVAGPNLNFRCWVRGGIKRITRGKTKRKGKEK